MGSGWGGVRACAGFEWQDPDKVKRPNENSHSMVTEFACVARCLVWCCHVGFLPEFGNYSDRKGDDRDRKKRAKVTQLPHCTLRRGSHCVFQLDCLFKLPKPGRIGTALGLPPSLMLTEDVEREGLSNFFYLFVSETVYTNTKREKIAHTQKETCLYK